MANIAALLTCHNRKSKTLACLESLYGQEALVGVTIHIILVDDGCTDGTVEAVKHAYSDVEILTGNGQLFWNGGMCLALSVARSRGYDGYLLVNDDTVLLPNALHKMIGSPDVESCSRNAAKEAVIYVGSTTDQWDQQISYGGFVLGGYWSPLKLKRIMPNRHEYTRCDTFNCNCVFISSAAMVQLQGLDENYQHAMGDLDLGMRAKRKGIPTWLVPGTVGYCDANPGLNMDELRTSSLREKWTRFTGIKGIPPREWMLFTKRHGGPLWPLYFANPYIKLVFKHFFNS